jgi:putative ABC transport system permease protein
VSAIIGFCIAAGIGLIIVDATTESALPVIMTPLMSVALFLLTVAMCVLSAAFAIVQVIRLDPAVVFAR